MKMPRMDGETMISEVRKSRPDLPVLVITGSSGDEIVEKVQKLGVVDTIIKPFHNSEIVNSINKALLRKNKLGCSKPQPEA